MSNAQQRDTNTKRTAVNIEQKENLNYWPVNNDSEDTNENNTIHRQDTE